MRDMILPVAKNLRADEMWSIIFPHVDFEDKTVIDLGSGYGDMVWRAWKAGAKSVLGIDKEPYFKPSIDDYFFFKKQDINHLDDYLEGDIIFCFSVLPYLSNPDNTLRWIRDHGTVALLEVQYADDGPGFSHIHNDDDMRQWLENVGWQQIKILGRTHTKIRPAWRTIWRCE